MKSVFDMTGTERAAALLVALGPDIASDIIKHLDEDSVDMISLEIARIDTLSAGEKEDLIGEFLIDLRKSKNNLYAGESKARELLIEAFGKEKADGLLKKFSTKNVEKEFDSLKDIESNIIASFLKNEHPQTISVTLSYLPPEKSASILKAFPVDIAKTVAVKMAKMETVSPEAVSGIAKGLINKYKKYLQEDSYQKSADGIDSLVDILGYMGGDEEKRLMGYFEAALPDISQMIRERIFTFDNVVNLTNNDIRIFIDEIDDDYLIAKALKGAGDKIRFKFLRNMSRNRATDLLTEMDSMGPIRLSEVEKSRSEIVSLMRVLNDDGVISLGKEDEIYLE